MDNNAFVYCKLYTVHCNVMIHLESKSWCMSSTQNEKRQIASSKWPTAQNTHFKSESVRFTWHVDEDVSFELERDLSCKSNHSECKCMRIVNYSVTSELVEDVLIPDTPSLQRRTYLDVSRINHRFGLNANSRVSLTETRGPDTGWFLRVPPASANQQCNAARTDVRKRRWFVAHPHYNVHGLPPAFSAVTFPGESYSQAHPSKKCPSAKPRIIWEVLDNQCLRQTDRFRNSWSQKNRCRILTTLNIVLIYLFKIIVYSVKHANVIRWTDELHFLRYASCVDVHVFNISLEFFFL